MEYTHTHEDTGVTYLDIYDTVLYFGAAEHHLA